MFKQVRIVIGSLVLLSLVANVLVTVLADPSAKSNDKPGLHNEPATHQSQLTSPAAAYTAFRQAQAPQDWAREYQCYSPRQQARFSHTIVVTALQMEFETDLYLEVEAALACHGLSEEDLAGFWPKATYEVVDEAAPEEVYEKLQLEYEAALDRWQRDVLPKITNCAGLISTLQPLVREGARRTPNSTVAITAHHLEGYAYGRLRDVCVEGEQATGRIRVKSRFGAFVDPECIERSATDATQRSDATESTIDSWNIVLEDSCGLYCWLWEVAADIQTLAKSMHHPRLVIVGLATGDVAVGPFEFEVDYGDDVPEADDGTSEWDTDILGRVDYRDEGAEDGIANNGTRTVTVAEVRFRHIDGQWLIDSIEYR